MEPNTHHNGDDTTRQAATMADVARQVATGDEEYVSLKTAREIFLANGRAVSERTLQRACGKGHIVGKKITTGEGEKWFALKSSVYARFSELADFDKLRERHDATGRDASQHVAQENKTDFINNIIRQPSTPAVTEPVVTLQPSPATYDDTTRHDGTSRDMSDVVGHIEKVVERLQEQLLDSYKDQIVDLRKDKETLQSDKVALMEQLATKDRQIEQFFSSDRETKTLFGRLQTLIATILPGRQGGEGRYVPASESLGSGIEREQDGR